MKRNSEKRRTLLTSTSILGSSLIEVVIVVSILVIIASIFVIASHHLIIRARCAKALEDGRVLARAINNYRMDNERLPNLTVGLDALAKPAKYVSSIPDDPFAYQDSKNYEYYHTVPVSEGILPFVVVSPGPDGVSNFSEYLKRIGYNPEVPPYTSTVSSSPGDDPTTDIYHNLATFMYDPTNGLDSPGDIITFQK